jgi:hypothetical protein
LSRRSTRARPRPPRIPRRRRSSTSPRADCRLAVAARTPIIADEFDFSQGRPIADDVKKWINLLEDLGTFKGILDPTSAVAAPSS